MFVGSAACAPQGPLFELTPEQLETVAAATPEDRPTPGHPSAVEWDDSIRLIGWDTESERPFPGDRFDLTLAWQSRRRVRRDWEILLRLRPACAGQDAVLDHHAVNGLHPVMSWRAGQFILDRIAVRLPPEFPPGPAELQVGLQDSRGKRGPIAAGRLEVRAPTQLVLHVPGRNRWRLDADTVVWAKWHDDGLTFGFEVRDDDPWNPLRTRDADLWNYDVMEIFLDVDESNPSYVELQVSPMGALFDASFTAHRSNLAAARKWDSKADVFAAIDAKGWHAELFIPWSSLPPRPMEFHPIRANIYRIDRDRTGRRTAVAWSGPGTGDFHDRRRWGRLLLAP